MLTGTLDGGGEGQIKVNKKRRKGNKDEHPGQPPPHKQGISLPKTKRPEQPNHIQGEGEGATGTQEQIRWRGEGSENVQRGRKGRAKSFITVITT